MSIHTSNLTWSNGKVSHEDRCDLLKQKGLIVWLTGISGAGKSSIAVEVEHLLLGMGFLVYRLDGDNIRHGLCSDLGFSTEDRNENIRRIAEIACLFKDAGLITLVSFISPCASMRKYARSKVDSASFLEVYVKADLETCMQRDPKGLYQKAKNGQLNNFTGITSTYEEPAEPELTLDTTLLNLEDSSQMLVHQILKLITPDKQEDEN
ncbi:adenylyl-sulfate kinase [Paenibacillus polysaccharolyticus]|uniref:adenylyl-sulfate kinase n=1 Tax=Paenibacillus polysaccharolyticus TaxID=582692 RepID=UPI00203B56BE|nr:adenylyl-sulfate kinase [Paenibacillus polysaccharolyticus]MCM3132901.1 adenylyl-sulfate kinase [Paenibacillus polysaccharolyticus]